MSFINNIRGRLKKSDVRTGSIPSRNVSDLPLDHQLTFNRNSGEKWSFKDGSICLNNEDIEDILNAAPDDVKLHSAVADAVSEFKDFARSKNVTNDRFFMRAESILDKILCNMKRIYDEKMGGISLRWGDGAFLMNNVDVRRILAMYNICPTEKAKKFLEGIKSKLALILMNKNSSPGYEHMCGMVKTLYANLDDTLRQTSPIDVRRLPAHGGNNIT